MDKYHHNNKSDTQGQCSRKRWSRLLIYQVQAYCRSHGFFSLCLNFIEKKTLNNSLNLLRFFFFNYSNTDSDCLLDYRQKCWCVPLQAIWTKHLSSSFILLPWVSIKCGVFLDVTLDSFGTRRVIGQNTGRYFPLVGPFHWRQALLRSPLSGFSLAAPCFGASGEKSNF